MSQPTHTIYRHRDDKNVVFAVRELESGEYEVLRVYEKPFVLDKESLEANYEPREQA